MLPVFYLPIFYLMKTGSWENARVWNILANWSVACFLSFYFLFDENRLRKRRNATSLSIFFFFWYLDKRNRGTKSITHQLEPAWLIRYISVKVREALRAIDLVSLRISIGAAFIFRLRLWWCWRLWMSWKGVVSFHLESGLQSHIFSMSLSSVSTISLWNPNSVALIMDSLIAKSCTSWESWALVVLQPTKMTWPFLSLSIYAIPCLVQFCDLPPVVVMRACQLASWVHEEAWAGCLTPLVVPALLEKFCKNLFNREVEVRMISIGLGCFPSNIIWFLWNQMHHSRVRVLCRIELECSEALCCLIRSLTQESTVMSACVRCLIGTFAPNQTALARSQ